MECREEPDPNMTALRKDPLRPRKGKNSKPDSGELEDAEFVEAEFEEDDWCEDFNNYTTPMYPVVASRSEESTESDLKDRFVEAYVALHQTDGDMTEDSFLEITNEFVEAIIDAATNTNNVDKIAFEWIVTSILAPSTSISDAWTNWARYADVTPGAYEYDLRKRIIETLREDLDEYTKTTTVNLETTKAGEAIEYLKALDPTQ